MERCSDGIVDRSRCTHGTELLELITREKDNGRSELPGPITSSSMSRL